MAGLSKLKPLRGRNIHASLLKYLCIIILLMCSYCYLMYVLFWVLCFIVLFCVLFVNPIAVNKIYQSYKITFVYYLLCSEVIYKVRTQNKN